MLVACVLIRHFPFRVEQESRSFPEGAYVLLTTDEEKKKTVLDTSPNVRGVSGGTPLPVALSKYPSALQHEADPAKYERKAESVVAALEKISPLVEPAAPGCVYVGLDGLTPMFGSWERLLDALIRAVPISLQPQFGVAQGKFPAAIAALIAKPGEVAEAPYQVEEFLSRYPVRVLPMSFETRTRLERLGLKTLGDIARQRLGPMEAHFGLEGRRMLEMARGIDRRPVVARREELRLSVSSAFHNPTVSLDVILVGIEQLLKRALLQPEAKGRYARLILLDMRLSQRAPWRRRITFKEPVGSVVTALRRIQHALSLAPPPGPVEEITLTLTGFTGEPGRQMSLFTDVQKRDQLREEIAQLEARLGTRVPLYQIRNAEPWSRIPERRQVFVEYVP